MNSHICFWIDMLSPRNSSALKNQVTCTRMVLSVTLKWLEKWIFTLEFPRRLVWNHLKGCLVWLTVVQWCPWPLALLTPLPLKWDPKLHPFTVLKGICVQKFPSYLNYASKNRNRDNTCLCRSLTNIRWDHCGTFKRKLSLISFYSLETPYIQTSSRISIFKNIIIILQNDIFTNVYYNHSLNNPHNRAGGRGGNHCTAGRKQKKIWRTSHLMTHFDTQAYSTPFLHFHKVKLEVLFICPHTMLQHGYVSRLWKKMQNLRSAWFLQVSRCDQIRRSLLAFHAELKRINKEIPCKCFA